MARNVGTEQVATSMIRLDGDTNRTPLRFGVDIRSDKLVIDFMA